MAILAEHINAGAIVAAGIGTAAVAAAKLDPVLKLGASGTVDVGFLAASTMPLACAGVDLTTPLTSQTLRVVPIYLRTGQAIAGITFISGATAANTPTNWWFALYSPAGALLAQTPDQTSTAWAANTKKKVDLSAQYDVVEDGWHFLAVMVKATGTPTLWGANLGNAVLASSSNGNTADTGLTDTAPATLGAITGAVGVPYAGVY